MKHVTSLVPTATFPSLDGARTYEQARDRRITADLQNLRLSETPVELARVWESLERRGFHTADERAYVAESVLSALRAYATETE